MDQEQAINIIKNFIMRNKLEVKQAWLFGSFAKGDYHKDSDVDLALISDKFDDKFESDVEMMILRNDDELVIEPHTFTMADINNGNSLMNEITKTGIRII